MTRPDGFYWVRAYGEHNPEVAQLIGGGWWLRGLDEPLPTGAPGEPVVTSGRITAPGERMSKDELERTLVFLARKHGYVLRGELDDLEKGKGA